MELNRASQCSVELNNLREIHCSSAKLSGAQFCPADLSSSALGSAVSTHSIISLYFLSEFFCDFFEIFPDEIKFTVRFINRVETVKSVVSSIASFCSVQRNGQTNKATYWARYPRQKLRHCTVSQVTALQALTTPR